MRDWQGKRYWIVGASEGLGREVARLVSRAGAEVLLSARSEDRLEDLARELGGVADVVPMDVADMASVEAAAAHVGEVDGLIFLAGVYWPQKATEWHAAEVISMLDINLVGAARVLGKVVPHMVARGEGHVVLTGSLSGFRGLPGAVGYGASKAGIMSLAETMRADLRESGVEVQLANPGFIRTRLTEKNDFHMPGLMEPEEAARQVFELMNSDAFSRSFPAMFSLVFRLGRFLPDWLWMRAFR